MKKIGLLGGMSWESSALYYRLINEGVKRELGGAESLRAVAANRPLLDEGRALRLKRYPGQPEVRLGGGFCRLCLDRSGLMEPQRERTKRGLR